MREDFRAFDATCTTACDPLLHVTRFRSCHCHRVVHTPLRSASKHPLQHRTCIRVCAKLHLSMYQNKYGRECAPRQDISSSFLPSNSQLSLSLSLSLREQQARTAGGGIPSPAPPATPASCRRRQYPQSRCVNGTVGENTVRHVGHRNNKPTT